MTGTHPRLKQPCGWCAAGREVAQALGQLSDGAFRLFMWICLNADRGLGAIRIEPQKIAAVLGKTEARLAKRWRASSSTKSASQQPPAPFRSRIGFGRTNVSQPLSKPKRPLLMSVRSSGSFWHGAVSAAPSRPLTRVLPPSCITPVYRSRTPSVLSCSPHCGSMWP